MKNTVMLMFFILVFAFVNCSNEEDQWEETSKKNTQSAYQNFIKMYPESQHNNEANSKIVDLMFKNFFFGVKDTTEEVDFQRTRERDSTKSFTSAGDDFILSINNKSIDSIQWRIMAYDLEYTDGASKPSLIPYESHVSMFMDNSSYGPNYLFISNNQYILTTYGFPENTVILTKRGCKYIYRKCDLPVVDTVGVVGVNRRILSRYYDFEKDKIKL